MLALGGMALGVVDLLDVRPMTKADIDDAFLPNDPEVVANALKGFAWHVKKRYEIIPFAVKGKLNFFDVPDEKLCPLPEEYADHCDYLYKHGLNLAPSHA